MAKIKLHLPPMYNRWHQIKKENTKFALYQYLSALTDIMDRINGTTSELVGYLEDHAFPDAYVPDIPVVEGELSSQSSITIPEEYEELLDEPGLSPATAFLLIIQITMRLSAQYGTSLLKLTRVVEKLIPDSDEEPEEIIAHQLHITKQSRSRNDTISQKERNQVQQDESNDTVPHDKSNAVPSRSNDTVRPTASNDTVRPNPSNDTVRPNPSNDTVRPNASEKKMPPKASSSPQPVESSPTEEPVNEELLSRLQGLVDRGKDLMEETPVETNPLLKDFL